MDAKVVLVISVLLIIGLYELLEYREEIHNNNLKDLTAKLESLTALNTELEERVQLLGVDRSPSPSPFPSNIPSASISPQYSPPARSKEHEKSIKRVRVEPNDPDLKKIRNWKTEHKCYRLPDFTDICVYKNLCFDNENILFLDPNLPRHDDYLYKFPLEGREKNIKFDWAYWEAFPFPPPPSDYVPYMSTWADNVKNPYALNPLSIIHNAESIEFIDGGLYFAPAQTYSGNTWHTSMQGMNLWEAQLLNETLSGKDKLPPMDYVVLKIPYMYPGWERQTYRAMVQEQTQFLLSEWFYSDIDERDFGIATGYKDLLNDVPPEFDNNFSPLPRKNAHRDVTTTNPLCAKHAVIVSQKPHLFSGLRSSTLYQQRLFQMAGREVGVAKGIRQSNHQVVSSGIVVIDYRGDHENRNLFNHDDVVEMVESYGLEVHLLHAFNHMDSFEHQMDLISQADVYIIVHGAGMTNEIFLSPRSTLIEVSPYGMRVPMYERAAEVLGLNYINIVSWLKGPVEHDNCGGKLHSTKFFQDCQENSHLENSFSDCNGLAKTACVIGPLYDLEQALINAYDYLGININPRRDGLYSLQNDTPLNNYHHHSNFLWVEDINNFDPENLVKEYEEDHMAEIFGQ